MEKIDWKQELLDSQRFNKKCDQELSKDFSKEQELLGEVLHMIP